MRVRNRLNELLCAGMLTIFGCAHEVSKPEVFTIRPFVAPLATPLDVNTGDMFYASGSYIEGERIVILTPLDMLIPGALFVPFPVHIDAGHLEMTAVTPSWKYFCAMEGKATASFPVLGSVIRPGDCVGIRVSRDGKDKEWVVDNSVYNNGMTAILTASMSPEELEAYIPVTSPIPFKVQSLKRLTFDGYYGRQLHFTWEEIVGNNEQSRQFVFDYEIGQSKVLGIKGNQFRVLSSDDISLRYEWVKFDS